MFENGNGQKWNNLKYNSSNNNIYMKTTIYFNYFTILIGNHFLH